MVSGAGFGFLACQTLILRVPRARGAILMPKRGLARNEKEEILREHCLREKLVKR